MHQTRKGKDWHFGMKAHVGADKRGIVHSLSTTAANVPISPNSPSSCTDRSASSSAIRRTGASFIPSAPRRAASATALTVAARAANP